MKKKFLFMLMLFALISMAVAQPAMISKGDANGLTYVNDDPTCQVQETRDVLEVEIISVYGYHFQHPVHETCPRLERLVTSQSYAWYSWETNLWYDDDCPVGMIYVGVSENGYVKVTVGDDLGNTGTDSVWFDVKNDPTYPMENFIMEIGDDLTPTFSGIASEDHDNLMLGRQSIPGQTIHSGDFFLSPGEWTYNDQDVVYREDSLWIYTIRLVNICNVQPLNFWVPGMLLDTKNEGDNWYLDMKTILQTADGFYHNAGLEYVYFVYSVDSDGQRHHFTDATGNLVILPEDATTWQIPGVHVDPYYQCGVAKVLEDGTYELLSLSNKVANPLPDVDGLEETSQSFSVYPNPSHGHITVNGAGHLVVMNLFGQTVKETEINGRTTMELPRGIWFVKLGGMTQKIVVE